MRFYSAAVAAVFASSIGNKKVQQGRTDIGSEKMLTGFLKLRIITKMHRNVCPVLCNIGYLYHSCRQGTIG